MDERGDDRFFDQRNAKREQAQTFDMSTPERDEDRSRVRDPSPRRRTVEKSDVGIQALVTTAEIGTQSDVMLPHMVPALWHCQVPTSIIDMTPAQIEEAADEGIDGHEVSSATETTVSQRQ